MWVLLLLVLFVCGLMNTSSLTQPTREIATLGLASAGYTGNPNVILIVTDDQDESTLRHMPKLQSFLVSGGKTFSNTVSTYPLCCPSRATIQRGQYAHNTRVFGNGPETGGGWPVFSGRGLAASTVGTWTHDAGYKTAYIGKYMNGFDGSGLEGNLLPGYDRQFITVFGEDRALDQGESVALPAKDEDVVVAQKALDFVRESGDAPFFLTVGFFAPHAPATYEDRYADAFTDAKVPRDPNYNTRPDPDDPRWVRGLDPLSDTEKRSYDAFYRNRLRSLQTVDAFVGDLYTELGTMGIADNTYVLYYTDNGLHIGDHRMPPGKLSPYGEDTNFPLIVRGPGVEAGVNDPRLVGNHDIAPTIADMASADAPGFVDGRSVLPVARGEEIPWRTAILSERRVVGKPGGLDGSRYIPEWWMVRRQMSTYIRTKDYPETTRHDPDTEYYELWRDPYELDNKADTAPRWLTDMLQRRLLNLRDCAAESCRSAEGP